MLLPILALARPAAAAVARLAARAKSTLPSHGSIGRSVACAANPDQGYRVLNAILKSGNWRQRVRDSLYYVKPTDKRKQLCRLRSEAVFKRLVNERVALAKKMIDMGY